MLIERYVSLFSVVSEDGLDQQEPSAAQGYSWKEYSEKLEQLKSENFNLRLRIYFLEERKVNADAVKDNHVAVELQVSAIF
jgi:hypothetical protein